MLWRLLDRLGFSAARNSRSLFAAMCINAFGAGMFYPFALLFFTRATALSAGEAGLILTTATLITLAITPMTGTLVDRFGSRRLVIASQVLQASGFAVYFLVSSAATLFAGALLVTGASRMFFASFSTLVAQSATGPERDRWYGLVGVTQSLAASVSGFAASFLIAAAGMPGFRTAIALNACCLLLTAWLLHRTPDPAHEDSGSSSSSGYRTVLRDRAFIKVVGSNALFVLCTMLPGLGLTIYATEALHVQLWIVGILGIVQTALTVLCQAPVIRSAERVRRTRVLLLAGGVWVVACLLYAAAGLIPDAAIVPWLFISSVSFTAAQLLYIPTSRALAAGMGPEGLQGRYVAAFEFSWGVAAALGPALFGITFDLFPAAPWLVVGGLVLCAMVLLRSAEGGVPLVKNLPNWLPDSREDQEDLTRADGMRTQRLR